MRTARRSWLLLAAFLAATPWGGRAEAQFMLGRGIESTTPQPGTSSSSHVPLPPSPSGQATDTERLFQDRFGQSEGLVTLRQLFGNQLDQLFQDLKKGKIDNPDLRKQLEEAVQKANLSGQDRQPTAQQIEAARRLLEEMLPKNSKLPIPDPTKVAPSVPPPSPTPVVPEKVTSPPSPRPPEPTSVSTEEDWRGQLSEWLLRQTKNADVGKALDESPALRELMLELTQALGENSMSSERPAEDGWFRKALATLSNVELPKFDAPPVQRPSDPSVSSSNAGPVGERGQAITWLLIGGMALVLLLKLLNGRLGWLVGKVDAGWQLGPWPVRPEAVATREELVRGFDYLSLLLLGRQALSWNHREIAGRLGGSAEEKRRAANELATVYEKARYAPSAEALDETDIAAARRDLCYLAGVAGA